MPAEACVKWPSTRSLDPEPARGGGSLGHRDAAAATKAAVDRESGDHECEGEGEGDDKAGHDVFVLPV